MARIRKRLTYANVMSSLALFLVLGGGAAFAAKKIGTNELKGASVTTAKIKRNAVTASKIKKGSITTAKIANATVTNGKLADGSVTAQKLVPGFVAPTAEKLARSANVSASGTVLVGSLGIAQANLTHTSVGFYCLSGLNPAPVGGVATLDYSESGENFLIQFDTGQGPVCPVGTQAFVNPRKTTSSTKSESADAGFFLILY
ncbi:MAG: hypothetical protein QOF13_2644 [Solirubrobacterales bacterium]|jgi:hypothetical protein|nr:hypothetical protein [Solirubrobacterales bacterium]